MRDELLDDPRLDARLARRLAAARRASRLDLARALVRARTSGRGLGRELVGALDEAELRAAAAAAQGDAPEVVGEHELAHLLGRGGMAAVFLALHAPTGAPRALKVLAPGADSDLRLRFQREGEAMARIPPHPHVARVHAAGEAGGAAWLATELLLGGDLAQRLERGPLPAAEVVALGRALASGLEHVHRQGVLHRDLKPHNVLFGEDGAPRIVDLGLAKVRGERSLTATGALLGTPAYMAPEQVRGLPQDERVDLYGLGATLYHALAGRPPFEGTSTATLLGNVLDGGPTPPSRLRLDVPVAVERVVLRAMALEPDARPASAGALAAELEEALAGGPATHPGWRAVAALGLAALCAVGVVVGLALRASATPGEAAPGALVPGGPRAATAAAPSREEAAAAEARALELVAAGRPEEALAALEGVDPALAWRGVAAALLALEDGAPVAARWKERAPALRDPSAAECIALAASLVLDDRGLAMPSTTSGRSLLAVVDPLRSSRLLTTPPGQDPTLFAQADAELRTLTAGLGRALGRAPGWARPALGVRMQRGLLRAAEHLPDLAKRWASERASLDLQDLLEAARDASPATARAEAVGVLAAWCERTARGVTGRGEARPPRSAPLPATSDPDVARMEVVRAVLLLPGFDAGPQVEEVAARWEALVARGVADGVLLEGGAPWSLDAEGARQVHSVSYSPLTRQVASGCRAACEATAWLAWRERAGPGAAAAAARALRCAQGLQAFVDDAECPIALVRALVLARDLDAALAGAEAAPEPFLHAALLADVRLLRGEVAAATVAFAPIDALLEGRPASSWRGVVKFPDGGRAWRPVALRLRAVLRAATEPSRRAEVEAELAATAELRDGQSQLPWRTLDEARRHVDLVCTRGPADAAAALLGP